MKDIIPTEDEIREMVYTNLHQETSQEIKIFINGALWLRGEIIKKINNEQNIINGD